VRSGWTGISSGTPDPFLDQTVICTDSPEDPDLASFSWASRPMSESTPSEAAIERSAFARAFLDSFGN
jgi:hypothetical protein